MVMKLYEVIYDVNSRGIVWTPLLRYRLERRHSLRCLGPALGRGVATAAAPGRRIGAGRCSVTSVDWKVANLDIYGYLESISESMPMSLSLDI